MDDPRSVLESIYFSMRPSSNLCGRQAGHAEISRGALNENMYHTMSWQYGWSPYVDILYVVLDRGQKTINSWTLRMTPGGESSVNLGMPCEAL